MLTLNLSIVQDFDSYPMTLVGAEYIILEFIAGVQLSRCGLVGLPHRSRFVIEEASYHPKSNCHLLTITVLPAWQSHGHPLL
jgi:hypothetical protein